MGGRAVKNQIEIAQLLGDIVQDYMALAGDRVVISDENFDAPDDLGIYVLIALDAPGKKRVGQSRKYDPATGIERVSIGYHTAYAIEIISRGDDAATRNSEVQQSLISSSALRVAEDAGIAIWPGKDMLNLTAIEKTGSLRRFRLSVIVSSVEYKDSTPDYINRFPAPSELHESR
jgi:hypothetical protein